MGREKGLATYRTISALEISIVRRLSFGNVPFFVRNPPRTGRHLFFIFSL
jgi:hypothetical protein